MSATTNQSVSLYEGSVFKLLRENITMDNGVTVDLDIIRHPGASAIVPILKGDTLLMIKQYRHSVGDFIWEIPAGTRESKETYLECARRELIEETGYSAGAWQKLLEITPLPGYSDERIHIFLATGLTPAAQKLDADEVLNVHEMALPDAIEMIRRGDVQDGKTISGIFMANFWIKDKEEEQRR